VQNAKLKLTFIVSPFWVVAGKCKMQNAECKIETNFFVSAGRVLAAPDRMRELM
jgi:hypothetical protein